MHVGCVDLFVTFFLIKKEERKTFIFYDDNKNWKHKEQNNVEVLFGPRGFLSSCFYALKILISLENDECR